MAAIISKTIDHELVMRCNESGESVTSVNQNLPLTVLCERSIHVHLTSFLIWVAFFYKLEDPIATVVAVTLLPSHQPCFLMLIGKSWASSLGDAP
jgi:hypothetical protein